MTDHPRSPLENWFHFNLAVVGFALDTQARLGQVYLDTLEIAINPSERPAFEGRLAPPPQKPVIPEELPSSVKAQWMLGMLFAGWQLPAAEAL